MEKLMAIGFLGFILFIVFVLRMQKRKMMKDKPDESFKFDFTDNFGNFYRIVKLGGTKLLMRWPDEIERWNKMTFEQKKAMVDESEYKAKRGKLSKVMIDGAIGYQPLDSVIRSATRIINTQNQK